MFSLTGRFVDWQQGIGAAHATTERKRTDKMNPHGKDALYLIIV
jgi:hypothetical protein